MHYYAFVILQYWLGDRKCKTHWELSLCHFFLFYNWEDIHVVYSTKYPVGIKSFSLTNEDAHDIYDGKLMRINGVTS